MQREIQPPDVVTLGETMILFWPLDAATLEQGREYARSCGGAESNFCIALARLGHCPRWISRLGNDAFGRYLAATLESEGVLVEAIYDPDAPTAVFFKERSTTGPRRVVYYRRGSAASRLQPDDLTPEQFAGTRLLHLTGITPALSASCAATVQRAIEMARAAGALISFDPNVRPSLWPSVEQCVATLRSLISQSDIVLLGDEDAAVLYPGHSESKVLEAIRGAGPSSVVLKLGARGAIAFEGTELAEVAAYPVTVVDTVGAGDGFDAGYLSALLEGLPLAERLARAARVGAAAVAASGDWEGYPTRAALDLMR